MILGGNKLLLPPGSDLAVPHTLPPAHPHLLAPDRRDELIQGSEFARMRRRHLAVKLVHVIKFPIPGHKIQDGSRMFRVNMGFSWDFVAEGVTSHGSSISRRR